MYIYVCVCIGLYEYEGKKWKNVFSVMKVSYFGVWVEGKSKGEKGVKLKRVGLMKL